MRSYSFSVTEDDEARSWLIRSMDHRTVELEDGVDFATWASREFPGERFTVQQDPHLGPWRSDDG